MTMIRAFVFLLLTFGFSTIIYDSINHIRAEVYHRNGYIKQAKGYLKLANQDYKTAATLMPWEKHYHLQLAKSYEASASKYPEEFDKFTQLAITEYEQMIEFDAINPWYKARLGLIYNGLYLRTQKEAFKTLALENTRLTTINDPKNPLFTLHYAHLLYKYGMIDEAKSYYLKTVEFDNELTEAHFNLSAIYSNENNIEQMIYHYQLVDDQIKKLEAHYQERPTNDLLKKIESFQYARIALSNYYLNTKAYNKAYDIIQRTAPSIDKYELMARYFIDTNQPENAISIYKQLNAQLKTQKYNTNIQQLRQ